MDALIEQAKRGNRESLAELVREHYSRVYRFCARRVGDEAAKDAAQETFVTMQRAIRSFQGHSSFETWLLGIAHNQCRALAKKRRFDPLPIEAWHATAEPSHNPESALVAGGSLRSALCALSLEHREVVVMKELEGLTYAEIAQIVGVPEGTVKSRLHHAFIALRSHFKDTTEVGS